MSGWAIDLGTTNTGVAMWDEQAGRPRMLELPSICRVPDGEDQFQAPRLVPSATHMLEARGVWSKVGRWPTLARRVFWGELAKIGREALERNEGRITPNYTRSFKQYLGLDALRIIARAGKERHTARDVAHAFLRELLRHMKLETGKRVRDLVITTPVESFESYRAEVGQIAKRCGIKRLRFLDEPVAAAIGYGLGAGRERRILVVDFGGGTLDLALVRIDARQIERGDCEVIAKAGRSIGGQDVDHWLVEAFCEEAGYPIGRDGADEQASFWYNMLLSEARRVKEAVFFAPEESFLLTPPEDLRRFEARLRGEARAIDFTRERLVGILEERGLYESLRGCLAEIDEQLGRLGSDRGAISDVLMVGGSTLLPGVYDIFEASFGRDRVRAWQPFEAVAFGASAFAAGSLTKSDFIVHDYAMRTYREGGEEVEYPVVIPRGTRFPTRPDLWKRQFVPTCALGMPEDQFRLVICEIGRDDGQGRRFMRDERGVLHKIGGDRGEDHLIVPLNESNPTLGALNPPHAPEDKRPRLEISFGVNEERWLSATVLDLHTKKYLLKEEPVIRLL